MTNALTSRSFERYKTNTTQEMNENYLTVVEDMLSEGYSFQSVRRIILSYVRQDPVVIRLYNASDQMEWEINRLTTHHMGQERGRSPNTTEEEVSVSRYSIVLGDRTIGYLDIGRRESFFLTEGDLAFKEGLQKGLIWVVMASLLTTAILAVIFSNEISRPILTIKEAAERIQKGDYKVRADESVDVSEIADLAEAINLLSSDLQAQEMLRLRLTSDISHELRTPLNVLHNQLEAFMDGVIQPTNDRLEQCLEEVIRLTALSEDLEKLTDITQYKLKLNKEKTDIHRLIADVVDGFEKGLEEKKLECQILLENKSIFANVDKHKIRQVMINLLSNAIKYTPEKGNIQIRATICGNALSIEVRDTGIGISKEDLKYIFERFYRAENSRSRETGGAGLGLAITKGIVEAHGGRIQVESTVGVGTCFSVHIPL